MSKKVGIAPPIETQTIVLKNSLKKGRVPSPADLVIGEIALSLYKGEEAVWAKNSDGKIVKLNEVTVGDLWSDESDVFKSYSSWEQFQQDLNDEKIPYETIVFVSDNELKKRGLWTHAQWFDTSLNPEDFVKVTDIATPDKNGLLSKEDKQKLDNVGERNLSLTQPKVSGRWSVYNIEGYKVGYRDENDITLEVGFTCQWVGTYRWVEKLGYKNPEKLSDDSEWTVLTESGVESDEYTSPRISTNASFNVTLMAKRTGYTLGENNDIIDASDLWDSETAGASVTFTGRKYYGKINHNQLEASDLASLDTELTENIDLTVSDVSCEEDEYYVIAYPKVYGPLTYIIQDYAISVKSAFTEGTITITNDSGYDVELIYYVSNHPGAFTSATLTFK